MGNLSSYAYIIMMIHYLIQEKVLPCLQKVGNEKDKKEIVTIDGWNCWFYKDIDNLNKIWNDCNKNNLSIGELW